MDTSTSLVARSEMVHLPLLDCPCVSCITPGVPNCTKPPRSTPAWWPVSRACIPQFASVISMMQPGVRLARALASESTTFGHVTPSAHSRHVNATRDSSSASVVPPIAPQPSLPTPRGTPKTRRPTPPTRSTLTTIQHTPCTTCAGSTPVGQGLVWMEEKFTLFRTFPYSLFRFSLSRLFYLATGHQTSLRACSHTHTHTFSLFLVHRCSLEFLRRAPSDYQSLDAVREQVMRLKNRTNLLMYYTADEPDGSEDPLFAPASTAAYINALGPYRPSSLVLNFQDYFFANYSEDTPIPMQDTYLISINATYSTIWNTSYKWEVDACGCDNCCGGHEDIRYRMDDFAMRLEVLGWERSKTVWILLQVLGSDECVRFRSPSLTVERAGVWVVELNLI